MEESGELELSSGRRLYLKELRQFLTYEGLLEGLPTAERNQQKLERLLAENQTNPYDARPYLIRPMEKPIEVHRPYPFGTPAALPAVTCVGRFTSLEPARDKKSDYSGLVLIWFQDKFALPIDSAVVTTIQELDWEAHAADLIY